MSEQIQQIAARLAGLRDALEITPEEIAQWGYFMTVTNTFCTGQSIVIDGGESINSHFVWPKSK